MRPVPFDASIEKKIDLFSDRLHKVEENMTESIEEIETKATKKDFDELKAALQRYFQIEKIQKDTYDKRFNILIHGLEETSCLGDERKIETDL